MIYRIPDWDDRGNPQHYIEQPDGTFLDGYNERIVSAEFVRERLEGNKDTAQVVGCSLEFIRMYAEP